MMKMIDKPVEVAISGKGTNKVKRVETSKIEVDVPQTGELLSKIDALISSQNTAMLKHSEKITLILKTLQDIAANNPNDSGSIETAVTSLLAYQEQPKPSYHFNVLRDGRGLISAVDVTPNERVLN